MLRVPTRPVLALLGCLLWLAACAPTATVSVPSTATTMPISPTPVLAPTPTNVPSGWQVLATTTFSLAYPSDWTVDGAPDAPSPSYVIWGPAKHGAVQVTVAPQAEVPQEEMTLYCQPQSAGARQTTLAGLPMTLQFVGIGNKVRVWRFVNAQQRLYLLTLGDQSEYPAIQAQQEAILATFRPDNATPWHC